MTNQGAKTLASEIITRAVYDWRWMCKKIAGIQTEDDADAVLRALNSKVYTGLPRFLRSPWFAFLCYMCGNIHPQRIITTLNSELENAVSKARENVEGFEFNTSKPVKEVKPQWIPINPGERPPLYEYNGEINSLQGWADKVGLTSNALYKRIRNGWPAERVLNTPPDTSHQRKKV